MWFMTFRPGIKFRLLLLGVAPAALIGLILAAYFIPTRVADLDWSLRQRGELIARHIAAASASALGSGNYAALRDLADAALHETDVIEVTLFDHAKPVVTSKPNYQQDNADNEANRLVVSGPIVRGSQSQSPVEESDSQARQSTTQSDDATIIGAVRIVLSRRETLNNQRQTIIYSLWVLFGGLLLTGLLAYRVGVKISAPILTLTAATHALSKGRLNTRAQSRAEAELAYLQAAFNAMATELQKNRQNLEDQVQQATRQLQDTLKSLQKRNAELELARRHAEMQTELKSQFLGQMSHEIRTPMNGIIGFSEILAQTPLSEEQAEQLRLIERSAKNLLAIINEILDLSKLEAGKISLNVHEFMLRPYLEDAIALQTPRAPHLPIILWIEPAVPQAITGDPVRIQQVINNLLGNALKFTRQGRIIVRVRLQATAEQPRLLFSVSDSGDGISPKDRDNLFVPFLQLSEYAVNHERGAGLGLAIAKNIVERMEGRIRVASRLGKGTTFWFTLPLVPVKKEMERATPEFNTVLIDSDPLSRQALRYQLECLGTTVSCFASFDEFIREYDAEVHGRHVLLNAQSWQDKPGTPISRWLEQSRAKDAIPILILRERRQRLLNFFRQLGAICLSQPVGSERLRAALRSPVSPAYPEYSEHVPKPEPTHRDQCFLVADDNEINRMLLRAQLSKFGAQITEARDGREALDLMMARPFDLIFLDLQMPVMGGLAVMQELRGAPGVNRNTPVVAITAHAQPEQKEAVMRNGFADCLIKPITDNQLVEMIKRRPVAGKNPRPAQWEKRSGLSDLYSRALLEKTDGNHELALTIARKLFQELPEQLQGVQAALLDQKVDTAQRLTHMIHGSAAFCGFADLRQAAAKLESGLIHHASGKILRELQDALVREIDLLVIRQDAILAALAQTPDHA